MATSTEYGKDQMSHTPGPWYQLGSDVMPDRDGLEMTATIARCIRRRGRKAEAEANARLIAAAPELLEALKDAEYCIERFATRLGVEHKGVAALQSVRAAIRKAKGEA